MERLRHRDRLLSLKYSTIEACFSVPMLNITLPSFPFVLAFAVKGLGWQAGAIGLMAALPHFCNWKSTRAPGLLIYLGAYRIGHVESGTARMDWSQHPRTPAQSAQSQSGNADSKISGTSLPNPCLQKSEATRWGGWICYE